jgi:prephenate dehydratase
MACRGLRGATTVEEDTPSAIWSATAELLETIQAANDLCPPEVASVIFTATPDITAAFPAQAARSLGWTSVPLLDAVEMAVPGSLPGCIRVLLLWNTDRPPESVRHVYLRGATVLRPDLASTFEEPDCRAAEENRSVIEPQASPSFVQPSTSSLSRPTVAYQGEPGAYSQEAIFQHFGADTGTLACRSFEEIFAAVEEGRADFGLQPVENSQAGSVHQAYDLLLEHDLQVVGEVKLRVRHCLLAPRGTDVEGIQRVRSHPQALAQTERYLRRHGWQPVIAYDTAGAARELAAEPEPGTAAVASALAGKIYDLDVLETGIEDSPDNTTRFFLLSRDRGAGGILLPPARAGQKAEEDQIESGTPLPDGDLAGALMKTSLVFATAHAPGALHRALGEFANRGLNLTKIESRPRRNRPWHYVFYLDFEGHYQDPAVAQALVALLSHSAFVKLLGSYPAAE